MLLAFSLISGIPGPRYVPKALIGGEGSLNLITPIEFSKNKYRRIFASKYFVNKGLESRPRGIVGLAETLSIMGKFSLALGE